MDTLENLEKELKADEEDKKEKEQLQEISIDFNGNLLIKLCSVLFYLCLKIW